MRMTGDARGRRARMVCAMVAATIGAVSQEAGAFQLKHAANGKPLRWAESEVTYVVDPSVEQAVPGGAKAVSDAVGGWVGASGGPMLVTVPGKGGAKPGLDGQNSVLFAPDGFAPAGRALAVTVTSYEDSTGTIVDSDIVINGVYAFAVLAADAKPAPDATPVSTDGASADASGSTQQSFDLLHVLSHETGHSLGLADDDQDASALMYAFTLPGDASVRGPSADDVSGLQALYGTAAAPLAAEGTAGGQGGCGQASVAGAKARPGDAWTALLLLVGASLWLASRRRARLARAMIPVAGALLAFLARPVPALSASRLAATPLTARVVGVSTSSVGGIFQTTLDLAPTAQSAVVCPARARARVWGGTLGGITQRVGAEAEVPGVGDVVGIALLAQEVGVGAAGAGLGVVAAEVIPAGEGH